MTFFLYFIYFFGIPTPVPVFIVLLVLALESSPFCFFLLCTSPRRAFDDTASIASDIRISNLAFVIDGRCKSTGSLPVLMEEEDVEEEPLARLNTSYHGGDLHSSEHFPRIPREIEEEPHVVNGSRGSSLRASFDSEYLDRRSSHEEDGPLFGLLKSPMRKPC